MPDVNVVINFTKIDEKDFDPSRPLRIASVSGGKIIDEKIVTPAQEKDPRQLTVQLSIGDAEDGVAGADIVVAPADDERNVFSQLAGRKFVSGKGDRIDAGSIVVNPGIYAWWRLCWFPRQYRVTGRLLRHVDECAHPIAGARVEIYDVDYCWWWFSENLIVSQNTDANGFFDIRFSWCVPLWCLLQPIRTAPLLIDPYLRDRLRDALKEKVQIKFPLPPPPPDPMEWEKQLGDLGVDLPPVGSQTIPTIPDLPAASSPQGSAVRLAKLTTAPLASAVAPSPISRLTPAASLSPKISASDIFGSIIRWPPCDDRCDWLPDIKIRVTQNQPGGSVVIYEDTWSQIHFDQVGDILNLSLEANGSALYADDCSPDPILGNCMLLDAVGTIKVMPTAGDPLSGIYQPDVTAGVSYGVTPDRRQRLGYVVNDDRPWAQVVSVYGRFGIAANVDYYQVQVAKWTNADLLAWDTDHTYVPPDAAFAPVPGTALPPFSRSYLEENPLPLHWPTETFGPNTVSGIPLLYKSRERFEQEYRDSHGGSDPAPDFGGWYWYYFTETRLFDIDSSKMSNGYYTFRFVCYQQTGVDGSGNPILVPVNMGLPGGIGKRCTTARPELLTLYLHDDVYVPDCDILTFTKNGVDVVDECAMVTLTPSDWLEIEYQAFDSAGNLDAYSVTLQKGFSPEQSLFGLAGVTAVSGTTPEGPSYTAALADLVSPAVPPYWNGGTWTKRIPYSTFVAMGGSCAYNLRLTACDRHTNGFTSSCGLGYCQKNRAFTVILQP